MTPLDLLEDLAEEGVDEDKACPVLEALRASKSVLSMRQVREMSSSRVLTFLPMVCSMSFSLIKGLRPQQNAAIRALSDQSSSLATTLNSVA